MAGKRITDLSLAPTLFPFDYIPVARDTQTVRVPGSAFIASDIYEPHRLVNEYSSQKYLFVESDTLTITDLMNNAFIGVDTDILNVVIDSNGIYPLGFQVEIFSARDTTIKVNLQETFSFKTPGDIPASAAFKGRGGDINAFESLRLIYIKPNIWLKLPVAAGAVATPTAVTIIETTQPPVVELPPLPTETVVVVDTTGTKPDLVSIFVLDGVTTELVSIGSTSTTLQAINGNNAYD